MGDTNSIEGIVKILESPKQKILKNNIPVTKVRAQFPQAKNSHIVHLTFWGKLARDVKNYYKTNDYILIEGYLSLRSNQTKNSTIKMSKKVEITVLKVYPFRLNSDRSITYS